MLGSRPAIDFTLFVERVVAGCKGAILPLGRRLEGFGPQCKEDIETGCFLESCGGQEWWGISSGDGVESEFEFAGGCTAVGYSVGKV
jgi:hypothetical protein